MGFSNVDIGTYPSDGTGDPLRTAFDKINQNFANIASGDVTVSAPVQSVAGRTGNILLTVTDILGANTIGQTYTMGDSADWPVEVYTVSQALDQLASRLRTSGY